MELGFEPGVLGGKRVVDKTLWSKIVDVLLQKESSQMFERLSKKNLCWFFNVLVDLTEQNLLAWLETSIKLKNLAWEKQTKKSIYLKRKSIASIKPT